VCQNTLRNHVNSLGDSRREEFCLAILKDLPQINVIWASVWLSSKAAFYDASPRVFRRYTRKLSSRLFFFFVNKILDSLRVHSGSLTKISKQLSEAADYFRH
jgi:hypothetical protein